MKKTVLTPAEWLEYYTDHPNDFAAFLVDVNEQSQELFRLQEAVTQYHKLTEAQRSQIERLRDVMESALHTYEHITSDNFAHGLDKDTREAMKAALAETEQE